jgi:hypothetical protein
MIAICRQGENIREPIFSAVHFDTRRPICKMVAAPPNAEFGGLIVGSPILGAAGKHESWYFSRFRSACDLP